MNTSQKLYTFVISSYCWKPVEVHIFTTYQIIGVLYFIRVINDNDTLYYTFIRIVYSQYQDGSLHCMSVPEGLCAKLLFYISKSKSG